MTSNFGRTQLIERHRYLLLSAKIQDAIGSNLALKINEDNPLTKAKAFEDLVSTYQNFHIHSKKSKDSFERDFPKNTEGTKPEVFPIICPLPKPELASSTLYIINKVPFFISNESLKADSERLCWAAAPGYLEKNTNDASSPWAFTALANFR